MVYSEDDERDSAPINAGVLVVVRSAAINLPGITKDREAALFDHQLNEYLPQMS